MACYEMGSKELVVVIVFVVAVVVIVLVVVVVTVIVVLIAVATFASLHKQLGQADGCTGEARTISRPPGRSRTAGRR